MTEIIERIIALFLGLILLPIIFFFGLLIKLVSDGPIIHWSKRIGKENRPFFMPKLRTMVHNAPQVATHLVKDPKSKLIIIGPFLRKFSIDELPQFYSVVRGDISFFGPRPALFNQHDLIDLRTNYDIHKIKPGITGWAQVNGRDNLTIKEKVELDKFYLKNKSMKLNIIILIKTLLKVFFSNDVKH